MTKTIDALVEALEHCVVGLDKCRDWPGAHEECSKAMHSATAALAQARAEQAEPVDWRGHVEQRLLTWRQSFVNRSGDQLALDDFMDKESLDDLIDFVCDEYTAAPVAKLEPPSRSEVVRIAMDTGLQSSDEHWGTVYRAVGPSNLEAFAAAIVEAAHNAKLGNK